MVFESPSTLLSEPTPEAVPPAKVRIRFEKGGDLRFLSHHDLLRTFERMLRRAEVPFRRTQGFHPKPRLIFALSLPLGVIGAEEVVELELDHAGSISELNAQLARQAPPGLRLLGIQSIDFKRNAQVARLCYRVAIHPEQVENVKLRANEFLGAAECWVERTRPPGYHSPARRIDLRASLHDLRITEIELKPLDAAVGLTGQTRPTGQFFLEIYLVPTSGGTARPEEIMRLLGLPEITESGAVLERTRLELADEITSTGTPADANSLSPVSNASGATPLAEGYA